MLTTLAIVASTMTTPAVTPQCEYRRYLTAGVWSALEDAERHGASVYVRNNLATTLRDTVAREREACQ
jgi:hypothetical protein